jgi:hypothetical protein
MQSEHLTRTVAALKSGATLHSRTAILVKAGRTISAVPSSGLSGMLKYANQANGSSKTPIKKRIHAI